MPNFTPTPPIPVFGDVGITGGTIIITSGTIAVSNFPATQPVSGTVAVSNFPATQPVSGTVAATQSGTWTVQPGNTANTTPWLTTINQGGNTATVSVGGALKVDGSAVTQPVSGTVTANIGTTNGLQLDTTGAALNVAQSTTLGTNTGPLIQGSVTTAAPVYTTGKINPFSLNAAGAVRTTTDQVSSVTLTTTNVLLVSIQIAAANTARRGFIIFNNSANSTYIGFNNPVVASNCIRLIATFTSWEAMYPVCWTGAIYAIRNSGTGGVSVWEF